MITGPMNFQISESQNIEIVIDKHNKVNVYGYQTEGLHRFDEVTVQYIHDSKMVILAKDIIQEIIGVFVVTLEKALKKELLLEESFPIGKVGCFFSKTTYATTNELEVKNDIFSKYWVWSSPDNVQTWLYNIGSKIYLEISPVYPWLFSDSDEDESCVSFDDYMKNYEPILIVELQEALVRTWIDECRKTLQSIEQI